MRCYFLLGGQIAGVEMLPDGLCDQCAVARADKQSSKRKRPIDGLEVWDGVRLVIRRLGPITAGGWAIVQWEALEQTSGRRGQVG
jgi:hypothetical protein